MSYGHRTTVTAKWPMRNCSSAPQFSVGSFIRFKAMAEPWQSQGRAFAGLCYGNQLGVTVGTYVKDLELIAKAKLTLRLLSQLVTEFWPRRDRPLGDSGRLLGLIPRFVQRLAMSYDPLVFLIPDNPLSRVLPENFDAK